LVLMDAVAAAAHGIASELLGCVVFLVVTGSIA